MKQQQVVPVQFHCEVLFCGTSLKTTSILVKHEPVFILSYLADWLCWCYFVINGLFVWPVTCSCFCVQTFAVTTIRLQSGQKWRETKMMGEKRQGINDGKFSILEKWWKAIQFSRKMVVIFPSCNENYFGQKAYSKSQKSGQMVSWEIFFCDFSSKNDAKFDQMSCPHLFGCEIRPPWTWLFQSGDFIFYFWKRL